MKALVAVTSILIHQRERFQSKLLQKIVVRTVSLLLQQSVERIARVRLVSSPKSCIPFVCLFARQAPPIHSKRRLSRSPATPDNVIRHGSLNLQ